MWFQLRRDCPGRDMYVNTCIKRRFQYVNDNINYKWFSLFLSSLIQTKNNLLKSTSVCIILCYTVHIPFINVYYTSSTVNIIPRATKRIIKKVNFVNKKSLLRRSISIIVNQHRRKIQRNGTNKCWFGPVAIDSLVYIFTFHKHIILFPANWIV